MKKIIPVAVIFICLVFLVACEQETTVVAPQQETKTLKVVSNVTGIQETRAIGDSVEGVLLTFHHGAGKTITGSFEITDAETVYLEALGRSLYTEDGRVYNYVLYMPELIRTLYNEHCQVTDDRGSSVWWYLSQYYGIERGDWESALKTILDNHEGLSFPKKEAIGKEWVPQIPSKQNNVRVMARYFSYDPERNTSYGGDDLYSKEFKHYYVERSNLHLICFPVQIYTTFQLGGGTSTLGPDDMVNAAMYWYLEEYFDVKPDDLKGMIQKGKIGEFLDMVNNKKVEAKSEDVKSGYKTVVSATIPSSIAAENFEIRDAFAFLPETLVFEDGTFITDNERPYIIVEKWGSNRTVYWIYLPSSFISKFETYTGEEWKGENDLFSFYLFDSGLVDSFDIAESYVHGKCSIPRDLLEKALSPSAEKQ